MSKSINLKRMPVLVINASYEPVSITTARKAFTLIMKGAAIVQEPSDVTIHTSRMTLPVPSVIRLINYREIPAQYRTLSRRGIMMRDKHTCQYCSRKFASNSEATLDHIVPSSKGGMSVWENLVACCWPCNNRKGDKTAEECGMKLKHQPRPFNRHTSLGLYRQAGADTPKWQRYLFFD